MRGIGPALGAEIEDGNGVLVLLLRPVLLLDLPLDRQAVAVPARNVVGVEAAHLAGAVDHVLEDLVQRGADMQVAVGVGRAVMQDELLPRPRCRAQLAPEVHRLPPGQHRRLLLRQVAAHGKIGGGQEHGVAIIAAGCRWVGLVGHGTGLARSGDRQGKWDARPGAQFRPGALASGRAANSRYDDPDHARDYAVYRRNRQVMRRRAGRGPARHRRRSAP